MMSASTKNSSEPRYTIEQISLLHRLLRTGLTKQDIIHALDSMTKLDAELQGSSTPLMGALGDNSSSYAATSPTNKTPGQAPSSALSVNTGSQRGSHGGYGTHSRDGAGIGPQVVEGGGNMMHGGSGLLQGMSQEVICGVENFQNVADEEVETLFRRGPMAVKSEIRAFLNKFRLSQNQISLATGISQSYISSFLIHGFMMKRSTQALLYRWYLGKKKEIEELGVQPDLEHLDNGPLPARTLELSQAYPNPNGDNFLPTFKRRERFTWKDSHVRILESYYSKNPYPNDFEREKITEACNNEHQQSGEAIPDSKWVTSSKVYNWFANRRKDANRRKRLSQRMGAEITGVHSESVEDHNTLGDHTHYASTSPQDLHVIEVHRSDGEHPETEQLSEQEVHVVELHMNDDQHESDEGQNRDTAVDQKVHTSSSDGKAYGGMNTIYTLIEAVQESDMAKTPNN